MRSTTAVFAVCFVYFALFRSYGFQVEDEGTLLFWLDRVLRGQFPYADFHTGYTPGYFYLGAALLKLARENANDLRLVVAVVNAASAAGLYALSRRLVGAWMAVVPSALWVAFLPVYPGEFASFNVPYPAWFATLAWIATALALVNVADNGRRTQLVVAGVASAAAFAIKPNAGAFALAAATWITVAASRAPGVLDRLAGVAATLAMALGVWAAFGFALRGVDAAVHLAPLLALAVLFCGPLAGRYAGERHPTCLKALLILGVSFLVPTLVWAAPVLIRLGVESFGRDVLLIGSNAAELYYEAPAPPERYALGVLAAVAAVAAGGALVRKRVVAPVALLLVGAVAAAITVAVIATTAVMPESLPQSISFQLENAAYWLAPLVHAAGLLALVLSARRPRPIGNERRLAVLVTCAVAMYWQVFPRTDFMHVIFSVALTLVLGTWLLERVGEWWREGAWPQRVPGRAAVSAWIAVTVTAVVVLETGPGLTSGIRCLAEGRFVVDSARLRVCVEPEASDDLAAFARTAGYLAANAPAEEAVLPFPALSGLLFVAGMTSPVPHDYWFPGRPSHDDERRMLRMLEMRPPRLIATLNDGWAVFEGAPEYFRDVRGFVTDRYRLVARQGRFDVLARSDVAEGLPREIARTAPAELDDLITPSLAVRRQAARRWMATVTPEESAEARLPERPRDAVLLLRALRDTDLRGVGWLAAGYSSTNPRLRREAVMSMQQVARDFSARRYRWANDYSAVDYAPYLTPHARAVAELARSQDDAPRRVAALVDDVLTTAADASSNRATEGNRESDAQALR